MNDEVQLDEKTAERDPMKQFGKWFEYITSLGVTDANAMTLATVNRLGKPSLRVMLMKDYGARGITFYTNYTSRKAKDISESPFCSINFFWKEKWMQVRVEGRLEKISAEESDNYFVTRPLESRIGAWASAQSTFIADRAELDARFAKAAASFEGKEVTRPSWWGGYLLVPDYFEFWVGRAGRLHDRICYQQENNGWKISRLSP